MLLQFGCTLGPDFVRPKPPEGTQYTPGTEPSATPAADGHLQRFDQGFAVPEKWWQLLSASKLDPVVMKALNSNASLESALATLRQSQELYRAGAGVFYPQLSADAGISAQRTNPAAFGVNAPGNIFGLFTLSATLSYALDIFGGNRRAVEGLGAQVDAQHSIVLATYITLTGNLVSAVIASAALCAQIESTEQLIQAQKEQLSVSQAQVRAGTIPYLTLLSLKSQLSTVEATLPPLRQRLDQSEHLLATLSGEAPGAFTPPGIGLAELNLPEKLPRSLPSELVRQRPDILQAEAQLHAASAQIGVTTAALFPSFNLSASAGINNSSLDQLFTSESGVWNLGANLTAPLFRGGTLRAQRKAAIAAFQASLATYRQTVLSAFSQVADTLRALEHDAEE
ncbi:MAG: efflux transporter outer membrane subunit, partial [Bdellovibrionota bacterium]